MAHKSLDVNNHEEHSHGSFKSYIIGFALSIIFTIIPFLAVVSGNLSKNVAVFIIALSAVIQLLIQVICFMHITQEKKPMYLTQSFIFSIIALFIIVGGSLWVMYEMAYHMHL